MTWQGAYAYIPFTVYYLYGFYIRTFALYQLQLLVNIEHLDLARLITDFQRTD